MVYAQNPFKFAQYTLRYFWCLKPIEIGMKSHLNLHDTQPGIPVNVSIKLPWKLIEIYLMLQFSWCPKPIKIAMKTHLILHNICSDILVNIYIKLIVPHNGWCSKLI